MNLLRSLLMLAVTVALLAVPASVEAAKKKKGAGAAGVVEKIEEGSLVIKVAGKKKKGEPAPEPMTKKFALTKETKFEKVSGKKNNTTTEPATVADLKTGDRVVITANDKDEAETVKIFAGKKKK